MFNYHNIKYNENQIIIYLDGNTVLPGIKAKLTSPSTIQDPPDKEPFGIIEFVDAKFYCIFDQTEIFGGAYLTLPNNQTAITVKKDEGIFGLICINKINSFFYNVI